MAEYQLINTPTKIKKVFTLATTESAAVKFDVSALPAIEGKTVTRLSIVKLNWAVMSGFAVRVLFDRSAGIPAEAMILTGTGSWEGQVKDKGTGNTGDIQFTTAGTAGTYWVEMEVVAHVD